jgi:Lrp/AsnC family transcriptional regulator, leucine-responsive regulatory protein
VCPPARVAMPQKAACACGFAANLCQPMKKNTPPDLDEFDRRILARWQRDTRQSAERIGSAVGLSAAAVQRRLKRLRETGVIAAEVARLDPAALGPSVTCIVAVDLDRERAADLDRFKQRMAALDAVQQCYYVTGSADFILVVLHADMASYESFTRQHLLSDGNIKSFTTHVVMEAVKTGTAVPL